MKKGLHLLDGILEGELKIFKDIHYPAITG